MIRKSLLIREIKRKTLFNKFFNLRKKVSNLKRSSTSIKDYFKNLKVISKIPRNSMEIRMRNRCLVTGRPKGVYNFFGLSRHIVREFSFDTLIPGLRKSSW